MGRTERRERTALDEAYRYFQRIESGEEVANLFLLNKSVKTLSFALAFSDTNEFKLTRQLWRRLHQALFDRLITSFPGQIAVYDSERKIQEIRNTLPEYGYLEFIPDRCRRTDDINEIEIARLYPKTHGVIKRMWEQKGAFIKPADFDGGDCDNGVCYMKPMVVGQDVLCEESKKGKDEAHSKWWELYWQAYCINNKKEQDLIQKQMNELESVWGNLYY